MSFVNSVLRTTGQLHYFSYFMLPSDPRLNRIWRLVSKAQSYHTCGLGAVDVIGTSVIKVMPLGIMEGHVTNR